MASVLLVSHLDYSLSVSSSDIIKAVHVFIQGVRTPGHSQTDSSWVDLATARDWIDGITKCPFKRSGHKLNKPGLIASLYTTNADTLEKPKLPYSVPLPSPATQGQTPSVFLSHPTHSLVTKIITSLTTISHKNHKNGKRESDK
jgi:hypothetical protein